jgi:hypothetical protein
MCIISERFLTHAVNELLDTILDYESDTFCAKMAEVRRDEAEELAGYAIHNLIDNEIDGVRLSHWLEEIRDKKERK